MSVLSPDVPCGVGIGLGKCRKFNFRSAKRPFLDGNQNKPGARSVRQLRERLNGRIDELPDGRVQIAYDFVNER